MNQERKWILLIPAVFAVSWAAILIRACEAPSTAIAFYRMSFAAIILSPVALTFYRDQFRQFTLRIAIITIISGIFLGWHFFFWIESLQHTSIASSVVLVTTQPIFVAILAAIFLKEKPGIRGAISIILALIGTVLIAGFDLNLAREYLWGDILALLGAVMAAGYLLFGRVVRPRLDIIPYIYTVYAVAAITLGIILLISGNLLQTYRELDYFYFILLAAGPTLIGHSLYNYSLKHLKTHKVGVAVVAEPVLASIWAIFIFDEVPSIGTIMGGALIILALILVFSEKG